jgi:outer membrane protein assembly factor BamA
LSHADEAATDISAEDPKLGFGAGSFIAVPLPFNDPTFGTGLLLGGGYLFKADAASDTSFLGLGVAGTNEGSRVIGLGTSLSFNKNRYSGFAAGGLADLTYDVFLGKQPVAIEQEAAAFQGEFRYSPVQNLSAGLSFRYLESKLAGVNGTTLPSELAEGSDFKVGSVGLVAKWDSTDDSFYPTTGRTYDLDLVLSSEVGGLNRQYTRAVLGYTQFWTLGDSTVIGARASICHVQDEAPFFDTCLLGADLRGFALFDFYGEQSVTAQAEYRKRLGSRLGAVAFAGVGEVWKSTLSVDSGIRYAAGFGLRYRISKDFGLDISLDGAVNDRGDSFAYLYVGQAF